MTDAMATTPSMQPAKRVDILGLAPLDLDRFLEEIGVGAHHSKRVFRALHGHFAPLDSDPQFGWRNAQRIAERGSRPVLEHVRTDPSDDGSEKLLFRLKNNQFVEGVLIPGQRGRVTLCISSQVGCGIGCHFCATGTMGLKRNLLGGEMIGQVHLANRHLSKRKLRVSHVVFMGMGEPFQNYGRVRSVISILNDHRGPCLEAGRITVSTVGIPRMIRRFGRDFRGRVQLALSLHAGTDTTRRRIIPIASKYSLSELKSACLDHPLPKNRHIMIEYVVLPGVNDNDVELDALCDWTDGLRCIVNLVPFNPFDSTQFISPTRRDVESVVDRLKLRGLKVSVRWPRGRKVNAACGQLALTSGVGYSSPM